MENTVRKKWQRSVSQILPLLSLLNGAGPSHDAAIFKRKLRSGVVWGYSFSLGHDESGKRMRLFGSGYRTKAEAGDAAQLAIADHQAVNGKITREPGPYGRSVWSYAWAGLNESGFVDEASARAALERAKERRAIEDAQLANQARAHDELTFADYFQIWIDEHAARRCAPKTTERYRELGRYLIRMLGATSVNKLTTDSGGCPRISGPWRRRLEGISRRPAAGTKNSSPPRDAALHGLVGSPPTRLHDDRPPDG